MILKKMSRLSDKVLSLGYTPAINIKIEGYTGDRIQQLVTETNTSSTRH